ncbi:unnamed protein product [Phytophthora lilii]|uniref:Unnamed protein product n=1 Tax=Phytophthora lilii TaxID=2077276 RepID=A0A9W6TJ80_9STRA|nr:unnamed protein product [Phytophthora lilii]
MDKAQKKLDDFLEQPDVQYVLSDLNDQTVAALHCMPHQMQANMKTLHDAYVNNSFDFERTLNEVENGTSTNNIDTSNQGGWLNATRCVFKRLWGVTDQFDVNFRMAMEPRQTRLQRRWIDQVERVLSKLGL